MDIDFTGFAGDCIITGRYVLGTKRLTDQLNTSPTITLEDVVLDGLDGRRVTTAAFTIERAELCAVIGRTTLRAFAERDPMVPLTDATIAYVVGGILEVVDAPTLIINRELAAWYRETDEAFDLGPASFARPPVRGGMGA